jgi:hypothetical protein
MGTQEYMHVFPFLFAIQLICELGDAKLEHMAFFRYRYSFEILTASLLFLGAEKHLIAYLYMHAHNCAFFT